MSGITDWLTAIGTISAVVISLYLSVGSQYRERKMKRHNMLRYLGTFCDKLFHEIEAMPIETSLNDAAKGETYKMFRLYLTIMTFRAAETDMDVLNLGQEIFQNLSDYMVDRSEKRRVSCLNLMEQLHKMR